MKKTQTTSDTGAKRSSDADGMRFDLISPIGLARLAKTYGEGAKKYKPHNYLKGFKASGLLCHAIRHLMMWLFGDRGQDHLGHAAWNIFTLMHFEVLRPELMDVPPYLKGITAKGVEQMWDMYQVPNEERLKIIENLIESSTGATFCEFPKVKKVKNATIRKSAARRKPTSARKPAKRSGNPNAQERAGRPPVEKV
jgi:hypothetical protein